MSTKKVLLKDHKQFLPALLKLQKIVEHELARGMRRTAWWGHGQVLKSSRGSKPKPIATTTFIQSWKVRPTEDGAILGNTAYHSYFVEVGRRAGKPPPLAPIVEWVKAKKFGAGRLKKLLGIQVSKKLSKGPKARRKRYKKSTLIMMFAFMVQAKIGRKGTQGRFPLRKIMPRLSRRAKRESRKAIIDAINKYNP